MQHLRVFGDGPRIIAASTNNDAASFADGNCCCPIPRVFFVAAGVGVGQLLAFFEREELCHILFVEHLLLQRTTAFGRVNLERALGVIGLPILVKNR